ncbi:hypothetical protein SAMN05192583_1035 [Sphingomonas gellani]|uniref:Uncharacterized protein n=1 Tax=Sphingomonas gellani TaxID=1166340 RepID=A0A1H8ASE4_9SPHN|nr:hypothetical protein [Sphingomonas gellani]SEM73446.1 hypothetical protein SAMN05192583_1035 [Sphingomonas gellani]
MPRHLLAVCCAVMLTACGRSTSSIRPSALPTPPQAATERCRPTPQHRQPDGSATAADDDATIRDGRFDLKTCDQKRQLLLEAWPR